MRLRKIGLGNPHKSTCGYGGLFFPEAHPIYFYNSFGIYTDKCTSEEVEAVTKHFKAAYRLSYSASSKFPSGNISSHIFADYSFKVCDEQGKDLRSRVENRAAILVVASRAFSEILHFFSVDIGEYKGRLMEAPEIRGGVPPFEGVNAYIEITSGSEDRRWIHTDPALSILEKVVTGFETSTHEHVFREILSGIRKSYEVSALCEHLHNTGQLERWSNYG